MIDWLSIFDEADPVEGASSGEIDRFVASVGKPLTNSEAEAIRTSQVNPFSQGDPLFASWRPFDPCGWTIPSRPLPTTYLDFLKWSNGGEFRSGERNFQFFPAMDPINGPRAMLLAYHVPEYLSGALPFAFDGAGTFYLFDMRAEGKNGEYPIVCSHSGCLGWEEDECWRIASTFHEACRGEVQS